MFVYLLPWQSDIIESQDADFIFLRRLARNYLPKKKDEDDYQWVPLSCFIILKNRTTTRKTNTAIKWLFQIYCHQSFQADVERDKRPGRAARGDCREPEHGRGVRPHHPSQVHEGWQKKGKDLEVSLLVSGVLEGWLSLWLNNLVSSLVDMRSALRALPLIIFLCAMPCTCVLVSNKTYQTRGQSTSQNFCQVVSKVSLVQS